MTFAFCTSLEKVNIPQVASIDQYAFGATGSIALTITMGSTPPSVESETFHNVTESKPVTVLVPSGAIGYDETWKAAFTGGNENINLSIQSQ
jgi:hypothetical protein